MEFLWESSGNGVEAKPHTCLSVRISIADASGSHEGILPFPEELLFDCIGRELHINEEGFKLRGQEDGREELACGGVYSSGGPVSRIGGGGDID